MKPFKGLHLLVMFGLLGAGMQPLLASTVQVGNCLSGVKNYPSISAAVGAVSAGSTVKVCPGTYPEQVNIFTPLTLVGISSGNSDRVVITATGANLASNIDSIFGDPIVAQVLADAAGTVNITNITVDGTGNNQNNLVDIVGVFYASGSSGMVKGVTTRQQSGNGRGYGIWAENGNTTLESVTIESCDIHDVDSEGIFVGSNQSPPTLTATVSANMITGPRGGVIDRAAGSITNNIIAAASIGIGAGIGASNSVLSNTITITNPPGTYGIDVGPSGATVKFNKIFNVGAFELTTIGILLESSSATVESNTVKDADIGIEFACHTGNTVSGNTIWDVSIGIDGVPSSLTVTNTYGNVDVKRNGC